MTAETGPARASATPPTELAALDLPPTAGRVLALMLDDRPRSCAEIAGELALGPSSVSRAVDVLADRGLLLGARSYGAPLALAPLADAVARHREAVERRTAEQVARLRELENDWSGLGGSWPGEGWVVLPHAGGADPLDLERPQHTYLAVVPRGRLWGGPGITRRMPRPLGHAPDVRYVIGPGVPRRPAAPAARQWRRQDSPAQVRRHRGPLSGVQVVDGVRAGLVVRVRGTQRSVWTLDPGHTAMLTRLFEALWSEAEEVPPER